MKQLALDLNIKDDANFESFYPGDNEELYGFLQDINKIKTAKFIYIWGNNDSGRTHLLMACCRKFLTAGLRSGYIALSDFKHDSPQVLANLENLDLLCLDDLNAVLGDKNWETAVFNCFNEIAVSNATLIVTANFAPTQLNFLLPDLCSRMMSSIVFKLRSLAHEQKIAALKKRALYYGLDLSDKAAFFLLNHYERDNKFLFSALKKLDVAALREKKKLNISLIKKTLNNSNTSNEKN